MAGVVIFLVCADMATTWYLLANYRRRVKEVGLLGSLLTRKGFYGHLLFGAARVAIAALVIQYTGFWGQAAWSAVTLFAVVNNLLVIRRLRNGDIH